MELLGALPQYPVPLAPALFSPFLGSCASIRMLLLEKLTLFFPWPLFNQHSEPEELCRLKAVAWTSLCGDQHLSIQGEAISSPRAATSRSRGREARSPNCEPVETREELPAACAHPSAEQAGAAVLWLAGVSGLMALIWYKWMEVASTWWSLSINLIAKSQERGFFRLGNFPVWKIP